MKNAEIPALDPAVLTLTVEFKTTYRSALASKVSLEIPSLNANRREWNRWYLKILVLQTLVDQMLNATVGYAHVFRFITVIHIEDADLNVQ